jgi:hypothetical protein
MTKCKTPMLWNTEAASRKRRVQFAVNYGIV